MFTNPKMSRTLHIPQIRFPIICGTSDETSEQGYMTFLSSRIKQVSYFCREVVQKVSYSSSKPCAQDVDLLGCEGVGYDIFVFVVLGCEICGRLGDRVQDFGAFRHRGDIRDLRFQS